ncbi:MAG: hypothetical protein ACLFTT_10045, partial [Candidatus Hydrogenedentota bacterium]
LGNISTLSINTQGDGSPATGQRAIEYTIQYEVPDPEKPGTPIVLSSCKRTVTWALASCSVTLDPPRPEIGGPVDVRVSIRGAMADPDNGRFGLLTSDAANWAGDIVLASSTPNALVVDGAVRYEPALQIDAWSADDAGLYETTVTGPGPENFSQCGAAPASGDPAVHSADFDGDNAINLTELLRIVQFFNAGGFACADDPGATEDSYTPGPGTNHLCMPHDGDYLPAGPDWRFELTELLRIVQFFNSQSYSYCPGENTEDGFCPGAGP